MKKMYKQPETVSTELMSITMICASVGEGDPVPTTGPVYGG